MGKEKFYQQSRFWVLLYAFVAFAFMCIQFLLGILENNQIVFHNKVLNDFVNGNLNLPMSVLSYGWTLLLSGYMCMDRVVDITTTLKLPVGQMSMGDLAKLRHMIVVSLLLLIAAVVFNFFTDKDYSLTAYASAFAVSIVAYTVGNKGVKSARYTDHYEDKNEDGIPDAVESAYNKWKRQQIKNGVSLEYLTIDYFLDDPANKEWEEKLRPDSVSTIVNIEKKNDDCYCNDRPPRRRGMLQRANDILEADKENNEEIALQ